MNTEPLKVMTLHQPYATLIALGVKTIETRSQLTNVRGRIAIHAATARRSGTFGIGDYTYAFGYDGGWLGKHDPATRISRPQWNLPRGAIVATAELYDCVPMLDGQHDTLEHHLQIDTYEDRTELILRTRPPYGEDVSDQLPYGHFEEGRWAWLLRDVQPLEQPVPFRGGQGWSRSWTPVPAGGVG